MAVISCGTLECGPFSEKTALCRGANFLSPKVGGGSSVRISVWECGSSKNSNNGAVCSENENVGANRRRGEDVISHLHIDERSDMKWWLPLFGWSQDDQELWANDDINGLETKGKAMGKSSDADHEKEMEEVQPKRSKSFRGRLTPEKAKLLRKNLRDTSTFREVMYHSTIASRLASPDNEGHD